MSVSEPVRRAILNWTMIYVDWKGHLVKKCKKCKEVTMDQSTILIYNHAELYHCISLRYYSHNKSPCLITTSRIIDLKR